MILSPYETKLIRAFYDYNRIPLWIYTFDFQMDTCFYDASSNELTITLEHHISQLLSSISSPSFDILCNQKELYFVFSFERNNTVCYLAGGPMLLSGCCHLTDFHSLSFASSLSQKQLASLAETLPVVSLTSFTSCLRIMMLLLTGSTLTIEEISNYKYLNLTNTLSSAYLHHVFEQAPNSPSHTSYHDEVAVLNCVKEGNGEKLEAIYKTLPETKYGTMSNNPRHQLFYGCIANTTLVTRYAIEGGLEEETAFTLSDLYIQQMEHCRTLFELSSLNEKMALDFTKRVAKAKHMKQPRYSTQVTLCMDYVATHLDQKITLDTLAAIVHLSPKYLSYLFHKETGKTLSKFVEQKRIEEAKDLLLFSDYSFSEISELLAFSSQSHFIHTFKKQTNMTPKSFRQQKGAASF